MLWDGGRLFSFQCSRRRRFLPTTYNAQPTAVLTARKAELASRSDTGLRKQTGGSKEVIPDRGPG